MPTKNKCLRPFITARMLLIAAVCFSCHTKGSASPISADIPEIQSPGESSRIVKDVALGRAYMTGDGVRQDLHQAAYWFEKAAGLGDPVAQNQIGYFYQSGTGVPVDAVRAVHWYQLSAANGLPAAKVNLANAFIWGIGVKRDSKTAEKLLREAADKGDGTAATYLGDMHFQGDGIPKDEAAGRKWYEKAIKLHSYLALFRMGVLLSDPASPSRDIKRAISLLRASASAGFVPAMYSAGLLLVNHPDICTSHDEALALLNEAATAGRWKSSVVLGALARDGKWVPQDSRQAYFYFRVGELLGGDAAETLVKNDLQVLTAKISQEDRKQLDEKANAWAREHSKPLEILYKDQKRRANSPVIALVDPDSGSHAGPLTPIEVD